MLFIVGKVNVEVTLDDYEKGALDYVNGWDFSLKKHYFSSVQELMDEINRCAGLDVTELTFYEGSVRFSVMVDNDNTPPSDSQFEAWKRGEEKLYIADGFMRAEYIPSAPSEMTDAQAREFGLTVE